MNVLGSAAGLSKDLQVRIRVFLELQAASGTIQPCDIGFEKGKRKKYVGFDQVCILLLSGWCGCAVTK